MLLPLSHEQETARLDAVRQFAILDTALEESYDSITRLASLICEAPVSLVTVLDKNRQWFKSHYGTPIGETDRQHSFCNYTIELDNEIFEVPDLRLDRRFVDNPFVTEDPKVVFYAGYPLRMDDGHALGSLCILDLKPRVLTETQRESLKILGGQVKRLIEAGRLSHQLKELNEELRRRNAEAEQFSYAVSHDLQAPLRTIGSFTEILLEEYAPQLDEEGQTMMHYITDAAERMRLLVQDLLKFSEIRKHANPTAIDLTELIESLKHDLSKSITEKEGEIIIVTGLPTGLLGFSTLLRNLFQNLISNALKFSHPGRAPRIEISYRDLPGFHELSVRDNGIGIEPRYFERIFEIFSRLHTNEEIAGTGIGLAQCRKIVDLHQGRLTVASEPGEGSVFSFTIAKNILAGGI